MQTKLLSTFLGNRLQPAQKFPQIRLKAKEHHHLTWNRRGFIPLSAFHEDNVDFMGHEYPPGQIVEVRQDNQTLLALGGFEPHLGRVDVFELAHRTPAAMLPVVSEDFFTCRLRDVYLQRRQEVRQSLTNSYRVVNGAVDGLPGIFIDTFSNSFLRIVTTTALSERLLPAVAEFFRGQHAEEIYLDTPTLGSKELLSFVHPTLSMPNIYAEEGVQFLWPRREMRLPTQENRYLMNPAHRRLRRMLRDLSAGKRVLCVNDRAGSATLNALMTAERVIVVETNPAALEWVREMLIFNHGASVFERCETVQLKKLAYLEPSSRPEDIVYVEHHPNILSTRQQWKQLLIELMEKGIVGVGTIVLMAQEVHPLGIPDLRPSNQPLAEHSPHSLTSSVTGVEMDELVEKTAEKRGLHARFLRAFSSSWDFPIFPGQNPACFSHVYLIQNSISK